MNRRGIMVRTVWTMAILVCLGLLGAAAPEPAASQTAWPTLAEHGAMDAAAQRRSAFDALSHLLDQLIDSDPPHRDHRLARFIDNFVFDEDSNGATILHPAGFARLLASLAEQARSTPERTVLVAVARFFDDEFARHQARSPLPDLTLPLPEFARLDESRQRHALVESHRRVMESNRLPTNADGTHKPAEEVAEGRLLAALIDFLYFARPSGGRSEPPGIEGLMAAIRAHAARDDWQALPVTEFLGRHLEVQWARLVEEERDRLIALDSASQVTAIGRNHARAEFRETLDAARAATDAAQARLDEERRAWWEEVMSHSEALQDGRRLMVVGETVYLVPPRPSGQLRELRGAERSEALRLLACARAGRRC